MKAGDLAIVLPSDTDDPLAADWAGEQVQVLRVREGLVSTHVYVVLASPVPGKAYRAVFREQDLQKGGSNV